jgi:hypothetical protein
MRLRTRAFTRRGTCVTSAFSGGVPPAGRNRDENLWNRRFRPMPLKFSVGPQFRTEEPCVCKL